MTPFSLSVLNNFTCSYVNTGTGSRQSLGGGIPRWKSLEGILEEGRGNAGEATAVAGAGSQAPSLWNMTMV